MTTANFHVNVRGARSAHPMGFIGQPVKDDAYRSKTGNNSSPQAANVWTISVPASPDNSTLYSITVDSVVASYTTDSSATQAELGAGLAAAFNAEPGTRRYASAAYAGGTITLTGVWPGVGFTPSVNSDDTSNDLGTPSESTAEASADTVAFGLVLASTEVASEGSIRKVFVPTTSLMTAQVITFTYGSVGSGDEVFLEIEFQGKRYAESVTYATSQTATLAALVTAMNTILDASFGAGLSIALASDATTITLTADVAGSEFRAVSSVSGAGTVSKADTTGPSTATSLARAFAGLSERRMDVEDLTLAGDDPAYPANQNVSYQANGSMIVQRDTSETWSPGDEVYVSLATATKGRVYNAAGTSRVWLPPGLLRIDRQENSNTSDGLGVVIIREG